MVSIWCKRETVAIAMFFFAIKDPNALHHSRQHCEGKPICLWVFRFIRLAWDGFRRVHICWMHDINWAACQALVTSHVASQQQVLPLLILINLLAAYGSSVRAYRLVLSKTIYSRRI